MCMNTVHRTLTADILYHYFDHFHVEMGILISFIFDHDQGLGITHIVNTAEGNKSANVTLDVDELEANGNHGSWRSLNIFGIND